MVKIGTTKFVFSVEKGLVNIEFAIGKVGLQIQNLFARIVNPQMHPFPWKMRFTVFSSCHKRSPDNLSLPSQKLLRPPLASFQRHRHCKKLRRPCPSCQPRV